MQLTGVLAKQTRLVVALPNESHLDSRPCNGPGRAPRIRFGRGISAVMRQCISIVVLTLSVSWFAGACSSYILLSGGKVMDDRIAVRTCDGSLEFELPLGTRQYNYVAICSCSAWYAKGTFEAGFYLGDGEFSPQVCRTSDLVSRTEHANVLRSQYECLDQNGSHRIELELRNNVVIFRAWSTFSSPKSAEQAQDFLESIRVEDASMTQARQSRHES